MTEQPKGKLDEDVAEVYDPVDGTEDCPFCNGLGQFDDSNLCPHCDGTGERDID